MAEFDRIAILGGGAWGTTLAALLSARAARVGLWCFEAECAATIERSRENRKYLPGIVIPANVRATPDMAEALAGARLLVFATPSAAARATLAAARPHLPPGIPVLNVTKGLTPEGGVLTDLIAAELPGAGSLAALSGPNLAREVAQGLPGSSVVASADPALARALVALLMGPAFRVYLSDDLAGVELGGALKNIFALGAGICDGLGFGDNTKAAYLTRALVEMTRAGCALGARRETFQGLSGMGDLIATSASRHSRNRSLGERIGRGMTPAEAEAATVGVAEGVGATRVLYALGRARGLDLPITHELHRILFEGTPAREAVGALMGRSPKGEFEEGGAA